MLEGGIFLLHRPLPGSTASCTASSHGSHLLSSSIPDISQRVLSATLQHLHADGLVHREAFAEVPPRVEYTLTPRGESFNEACRRSMLRWAFGHMADILQESDEKHIDNVG